MKKHKPKKIYLSVSYNTSTTVIKTVKKLIEAEGVEVLMYQKGEKYTTDKLLGSDMVLGIPYSQQVYNCSLKDSDYYIINTGKGQYNEAETAVENGIPYFMLTGDLNFSEFYFCKINNGGDWKKNYGELNLVGKFDLSKLLDKEEENNLLLIL